MKVVICDNLWQEKWDDFMRENASDRGLLQSWLWGDFQSKLGRKVYRIAVCDDGDNIKVAAQLIMHDLPIGKKYLYVPRGPIVSDLSSPEFKILLKEMKSIGL